MACYRSSKMGGCVVVRAVARDADVSSTHVGECLTPNLIFAHPGWTTEQAMPYGPASTATYQRETVPRILHASDFSRASRRAFDAREVALCCLPCFAAHRERRASIVTRPVRTTPSRTTFGLPGTAPA